MNVSRTQLMLVFCRNNKENKVKRIECVSHLVLRSTVLCFCKIFVLLSGIYGMIECVQQQQQVRGISESCEPETGSCCCQIRNVFVTRSRAISMSSVECVFSFGRCCYMTLFSLQMKEKRTCRAVSAFCTSLKEKSTKKFV